MSEIDWNDNAIAAVAAYDKWLDENDGDQTASECLDNFMRTIATRPTEPRKTVEDAVEAFPSGWGSITCIGEEPEYNDAVALCATKEDGIEFIKKGEFYVGTEPYFDRDMFYQVCTRAEFEKAWEERYGDKEEWTHTIDGHKCRLDCDKSDYYGKVPVYVEARGYVVEPFSELKPIKPTITKAEAWDKAKWGESVIAIQSNYEVR